jgi:hypothetical protein
MGTLISRGLSLVISVGYLIIGLMSGDPAGVVMMAIYLLLPLACIWFSEEMGDFTGVMRGHLITSRTPGCFVAAGGWLLLLLPVIAAIIQDIQRRVQ